MTTDQDRYLQQVIETAQRQIFEDGLTTRIKPLGIRGDSVRCLLLDENEDVVAEGVGSGGGRRAVADAMLQAIGSWLRAQKLCEAPVILADPLVLAEERALESEVPVRRILDARRRNAFAGISTTHIPLREYHDLHNSERVRVPLFLSIPDERYSQTSPKNGHDAVRDVVETYSTTAGSGVGASRNEALLRGIDECIERDALALLRVRSLSPSHLGAAPLGVIRRESLPEHLLAILCSVEADVEGRIVLLDLTTDLGIPVIAAVATPLTTRIQFMGIASGSSPEDVVRSALAELLLAVDIDLPTSDLSIDTLLGAGNIECVEYMTIPGEHVEDVDSELPLRLEQLEDSGFRVLASPTFSLASGLVAAHVLVPGLERGTGIADGRLLGTGDRGRAALDAALGGDRHAAWAS